LWIIHNRANGADSPEAYEIAEIYSREDFRIGIYEQANSGYAGAVNRLFALAETEYIAYLDNDAYIQTPGWDEILCSYLDRFHEIGIIFPNSGVYPIPRACGYSDVMWAPGFCWIMNRMCMKAVGEFDSGIGHQEEADYCMRVRMFGRRCVAVPEVQVKHDATSTRSPESQERISAGVVKFVNKWNRYFNGQNFHYHSTNVTRWEDWPPNALYLEEYWQSRMPDLNKNPETVKVDGREYDLIKVPRLHGFYTGRII
jgi:GT2 family glycosyltransferase